MTDKTATALLRHACLTQDRDEQAKIRALVASKGRDPYTGERH